MKRKRTPAYLILFTFRLIAACSILSHLNPFEDLYQRPGFLLRRAHQISVAIFEKEAADVALTPAQYGVLYTLGHAPGIDQSTLSRALGMDRVTVLRVAKGLESRGLIVRQPGQSDGRRLSLALTDEGQALLRTAQDAADKAVRRLTSPLSAAEQRTLNRLLNKLCATLDTDARAEMAAPDAGCAEQIAK